MRIPVVLSGLIACCLFSFPLSFAQTLSQPPGVPEETAELQPLPLIDSGLSGSETAAIVEDAIPSEDPQSHGKGKGGGNAAGRAKPTGSPIGNAPASTAYVFPTNAQMNHYWFRNTIGPKALLGATFTASWNQWVVDSPSEWAKDATGWGQRYGASLLDNGINTTSLVWISRATGQDPRYHRCDCTGFWPRSRHAMQLAIMSYNRSGSVKLSPGKLVAPFTGPMVTRNTIYPDRFGFGNAGTAGVYYLVGSVGWNLVREFVWKIW